MLAPLLAAGCWLMTARCHHDATTMPRCPTRERGEFLTLEETRIPVRLVWMNNLDEADTTPILTAQVLSLVSIVCTVEQKNGVSVHSRRVQGQGT